MVSLRQSVTLKVSLSLSLSLSPPPLVMVMRKLFTCWFTSSSSPSSSSSASFSTRQHRQTSSQTPEQDYFKIKRPPGCTLNKFKAWQKKYLVLEQKDQNSSKWQLNVYNCQEDFLNGHKARFAINIDNSSYFQVSSGASKKFSQVLVLLSKSYPPVLLASKDRDILSKWISLLTNTCAVPLGCTCNVNNFSVNIGPNFSTNKGIKGLDETEYTSLEVSSEKANVPRFTVKILSTRIAQKSSIEGKKDLIFLASSIAFTERGSNDILMQFPSSIIRKYGANTICKSNLTINGHPRRDTLIEIEVGRRSPTGEGELRFVTDEGEEIVKNMRQMLHKQSVRKLVTGGSSRVVTTTTITNGQPVEKTSGRRYNSMKETSRPKEKVNLHFHDDQRKEETDYINYQLIHESGVSE